MDKIEMQDNQKLIRVLYLISPEQKILMERLKIATHLTESELIRQAINMLMGAYSNALKGQSNESK
jgi:hypothetical protein